MEPVTREQMWFAQMFLAGLATAVPFIGWALFAENGSEHVIAYLGGSVACIAVGAWIGYRAPSPHGPTRMGETVGWSGAAAGGGYFLAQLFSPLLAVVGLLALQVVGAVAGVWLLRHREALVREDQN